MAREAAATLLPVGQRIDELLKLASPPKLIPQGAGEHFRPGQITGINTQMAENVFTLLNMNTPDIAQTPPQALYIKLMSSHNFSPGQAAALVDEMLQKLGTTPPDNWWDALPEIVRVPQPAAPLVVEAPTVTQPPTPAAPVAEQPAPVTQPPTPAAPLVVEAPTVTQAPRDVNAERQRIQLIIRNSLDRDPNLTVTQQVQAMTADRRARIVANMTRIPIEQITGENAAELVATMLELHPEYELQTALELIDGVFAHTGAIGPINLFPVGRYRTFADAQAAFQRRYPLPVANIQPVIRTLFTNQGFELPADTPPPTPPRPTVEPAQRMDAETETAMARHLRMTRMEQAAQEAAQRRHSPANDVIAGWTDQRCAEAAEAMIGMPNRAVVPDTADIVLTDLLNHNQTLTLNDALIITRGALRQNGYGDQQHPWFTLPIENFHTRAEALAAIAALQPPQREDHLPVILGMLCRMHRIPLPPETAEILTLNIPAVEIQLANIPNVPEQVARDFYNAAERAEIGLNIALEAVNLQRMAAGFRADGIDITIQNAVRMAQELIDHYHELNLDNVLRIVEHMLIQNNQRIEDGPFYLFNLRQYPDITTATEEFRRRYGNRFDEAAIQNRLGQLIYLQAPRWNEVPPQPAQPVIPTRRFDGEQYATRRLAPEVLNQTVDIAARRPVFTRNDLISNVATLAANEATVDTYLANMRHNLILAVGGETTLVPNDPTRVRTPGAIGREEERIRIFTDDTSDFGRRRAVITQQQNDLDANYCRQYNIDPKKDKPRLDALVRIQNYLDVHAEGPINLETIRNDADLLGLTAFASDRERFTAELTNVISKEQNDARGALRYTEYRQRVATIQRLQNEFDAACTAAGFDIVDLRTETSVTLKTRLADLARTKAYLNRALTLDKTKIWPNIQTLSRLGANPNLANTVRRQLEQLILLETILANAEAEAPFLAQVNKSSSAGSFKIDQFNQTQRAVYKAISLLKGNQAEKGTRI